MEAASLERELGGFTRGWDGRIELRGVSITTEASLVGGGGGGAGGGGGTGGGGDACGALHFGWGATSSDFL